MAQLWTDGIIEFWTNITSLADVVLLPSSLLDVKRDAGVIIFQEQSPAKDPLDGGNFRIRRRSGGLSRFAGAVNADDFNEFC